MHSFQLHERRMEVVHARIYHSGIVSVSYPQADAAPQVVLTTWDGSIHTGKIQLMQHSLPVAAKPGQLLETLALHAGPPVHSDAAQYSGQLQARFLCRQARSMQATLPYRAYNVFFATV